jgi:hypothetical protein
VSHVLVSIGNAGCPLWIDPNELSLTAQVYPILCCVALSDSD